VSQQFPNEESSPEEAVDQHFSDPAEEQSETDDSTATSQAASQNAGQSVDLAEKLLEAEKRVLFAQADLENFRKRMRREREDELKYANVPLISDLLPVLDNLQRAIESAEKGDPQSGGILDGVRLVEKQLRETMKKRGCEEIDAAGTPFDPNLHEAILQQPNADVEPGTVLQVTQVGYQMYDRVIRPSQVIVSKAPDA